MGILSNDSKTELKIIRALLKILLFEFIDIYLKNVKTNKFKLLNKDS